MGQTFQTQVGEQETKLTPDEFADMIRATRPHLLAIQDQIDGMKEGYGSLTIELTVRAFRVTDINFITKDRWLLTSKEK